MLSINSFHFGVNPIRMALVAGEPQWVLRDVAEALGYTSLGNMNKLAQHIPAEWKGRNPIPTPSGEQDMVTVSEPGLFFFLNRSDKPRALPMQKWVAGEVLPAIRRTGTFSVAPAFPVPQTFSEALYAAARLEEQRSALACTVKAQTETIQVLEPLAAVAQAISRAEDTFTVSEVAKMIGLGQNRLFEKMRAWGWVYLVGRYSEPYQAHVDLGNLVVKAIHYEDLTGKDRVYPKILVTGKGLVALRKRLAAEAPSSLLRPQHGA